MARPTKPVIVALVSSVLFSFGAVPAAAAVPTQDFSQVSAAPASTQSLDAKVATISDQSLDALTAMSALANTPHSYDVDAAIALAESEVGTSRATGWNQPGECISSVHRWVTSGGAAWTGSGDPVNSYQGATRLTIADAQPGDIVQYEHLDFPTSWVSGVHTLLITEKHDDGTFTIIQSNVPTGSGLVTKETAWVPEPPEGFQAVVWRF
ncbi:lipase [Leucobacter soli]|uniref:Lipase n=1 Tax=Leucobacter soli TaxID=2812850 RepID=A0A916JY55_9MICO|nr:lipase [Leucobacter soli]CAG7613747.1 hypothetical protein LEUCIP111803_01729 [Leucobacter soli]